MIHLLQQFKVFSGWAYGLRQPVILGFLEVSWRDKPDWDTLDSLAQSFFPGAPKYKSDMYFESPTFAPGQAIVERVIYWSSVMQQGMGLPVFETGKVLMEDRMPKGTARYTVAFPCFHPAAAVKSVSRIVHILNDCIIRSRQKPPDGLEMDAASELKKDARDLGKYAPTGSNTLNFLRAAHVNQMPWQRLAGNVFEFGHGARARWLDSSFTDRTPNISGKVARNKIMAAQILRHAGLPVPAHGRAVSPENAEKIGRELGFPVVVKPIDLDGGVAVSADLKTGDAVRKAFLLAREKTLNVMVEKHWPGQDYRLTVLNGNLLWAIQRIPGGVAGDGARTVRSLIDALNADPRRGSSPRSPLKTLEINEEARELLSEGGLDLDSVPETGRFVVLRRSANISSGGMPVDVTKKVHPDNRRLAERAAAALRLDLAGVDLLLPDIERSWLNTGGVICEVNAQPQLGTVTGSHLYGEVLQTLLDGDGRIPIVLILESRKTGAGVRKTGAVMQQRMQESFGRVGRASRLGAWIGDEVVPMACKDFFSVGKAILSNSEVDAVVMEADFDEVSETGLPFDFCDIIVFSGALLPGGGSPRKRELARSRFERVCRICLPHTRKGVVIGRNNNLLRGQLSGTGGGHIVEAGPAPRDLVESVIGLLHGKP